MKEKHWIQVRIARTIGRSIIKTEMQRITYFIFQIVCLMHTMICFIGNQSHLQSIIKWFDPSTYVQAPIIMYVMTAPVLVITLIIILQFIWGMKENSIQTTITKHYLIKISTLLALGLAYMFCLPIIRSTVKVYNLQFSYVLKVIAIVVLVFFLAVIYPFAMFLMTDLSPQNRNIYAVVEFPNSLTIMHLYRPIAAILVASNNEKFVIIPASIMFFFVTVTLIKFPIIAWRHNRFSQGIISCIVWTTLCRFAELATKMEVNFPIFLLGLPIFILFVIQILRLRVISVLKMQSNTVLKLKILYYLLTQRKKQCQQLDIFILHHYRCCPIENCSCHKIVYLFKMLKTSNEQNRKNEISKSKSMNKTDSNMRFKSKFSFSAIFGLKSKKQKNHPKDPNIVDDSFQQQVSVASFNKSKQLQPWFQLLHDMQNEQFMIDRIRQMPITEKGQKMKKAKQIILDQTQILHYYLDKQYQSLRNLWFVQEQMTRNNLISFFFLIRFCIQQQKQQETIQKKSMQQGSNQYALNYYTLQTKLLFFRQLLLKAVLKAEQFWTQLCGKKPNQYKIVTFVKQFLKSQKSIFQQLKKYTVNNSNKDSNNDYQNSWDNKIKQIIQNTFIHFQTALGVKQSSMLNSQIIYDMKEKQNKTLEKNLMFYDCNAKTGMGIVNVQQGQQFGSVSVTNKQFWQLLNRPRYQKARINHFLIKEMHEYHDRTIVDFLKKNKHFLNFHRGFIIDGTKHLVQIQFSVQLLPHVFNGLFGAVFLQQMKSQKSIFLTNKASNILAYNMKFQRSFLDKRNLMQFDEIINKEVIFKLQQQRKCKVLIENEQYIVEKIHGIYNEVNESQNLYYCQISQQWDDIPQKTKVIQDEVKQQFYGKSLEQETVKIQNSQKKQNRPKQKKQEVNQLINMIKSEKTASIILKWNKFIVVLLILICMLAVVSCGLSQLKIYKYKEASSILESLTNYIQHISQVAYLVRKVNLIEFYQTGQSLQSYVVDLKELQNKLTQQKKILKTGLWDQSFISYQITSDGNLIQSKTTFDMIVQKFLLSSFTTFITNINQQNFDCIRANNPLPYSTSYINFLTLLYNIYYTLIPSTTVQFRSYLIEKTNILINLVSSLPIVLMSIMIVFLCLIAQVFTIWLRLRIKKTILFCLKLIQKLDLPYVQQKLETLKQYRDQCLSDLYQNKKKKEKVQNKQKQKEKSKYEQQNLSKREQQKTNSLFPQITNFSKRLSMEFQDSTARQFEQTNRQKIYKIQKFRQKNKLKIGDIPKMRTIFVIVLAFLCAIAFAVSILSTQIASNKNVRKWLQLKSLYSRKIQYVKMIKSYSFQIGYQTAQSKINDQYISQRIPQIIQHLYQTIRQIKQKEQAYKVKYRDAINQNGSASLCKILNNIRNLGQTIEVCKEQEIMKYGNQSDNQFIIDFLETARSVDKQYKSLDITQKQQRQFSIDPRHQKFDQGQLHLCNIQYYILYCFNQMFEQNVRTYQVTIIMLGISILFVIFLVKQTWVPYQIQWMQFEVDQIKTILLLISANEISANPQLKKQILANYELFSILR